jgi:DNA modification methylase
MCGCRRPTVQRGRRLNGYLGGDERALPAVIRDIKPRSPTFSLKRDYSKDDLERRFDVELAAALVGMSRAFIARALDAPRSRPATLTLAEVLTLLDVDGYQETFLPRSKVPGYLLSLPEARAPTTLDPPEDVLIRVGNSRDLLRQVAPHSVQCAVTSSPYWGMRVYDNSRDLDWADGERCPYGFEQTPEGFIRHTIELLYVLKPAMRLQGSVWWNVMDTYNTRTPIRVNARERLDAMESDPEYRQGWTEHGARRHSAGHMYLEDAEQSAIPMRIAERASRIGYKLKNFITWRKDCSTPEPARSRVSRQAEYILHLGIQQTPLFNKAAWKDLPKHLGGPNKRYETSEKITDVWCLPTAAGKNGHGAEFPLALPGRCIALTSEEGDLVLDPFIGSGTTALAAIELKRRCIGFEISEEYVDLATQRIAAAKATRDAARLWDVDSEAPRAAALTNGGRSNAESSRRKRVAVPAVA